VVKRTGATEKQFRIRGFASPDYSGFAFISVRLIYIFYLINQFILFPPENKKSRSLKKEWLSFFSKKYFSIL
jgi:hypothetical protein